jgi:isopenicillin N synthase-like dioxygenase
MRLPTVDLSSNEAPRSVARACEQLGFFQVQEHGLPEQVIAEALEATDQFFSLPLEEKQRCVPSLPEIDRGYAAPGSEGLAYSLGVDTPADLFEAFNIGPDVPPVEHAPAHVFPPNVWPERPSSLRPALTAYFQAARQVADRVTAVMADALHLDPGYFAGFTHHSTDTLRCNNYLQPPGGHRSPGQQRMGAHTDYGIVTILYADRVPGLEIVGPDRTWHDVLPDPGALLVNLGDLLAQWTNDHWRSTLHRVVPPDPVQSGPCRRRSMAFFHDGNFDALIACLPTCRGEDEPARYPPVRAGDHLLAKLMGPRTLSPSEATSTAGSRMEIVHPVHP